MPGPLIVQSQRATSDVQVALRPKFCGLEPLSANALPIALAVCRESDGVFVEANPAMAELLGMSAVEIAGRTDLELDCWRSEPLRSRGLCGLSENIPLRNMEARLRTRAGVVRNLLLSIERIAGGNLLICGQDITEYERHQRQLRTAQKLEALAQFAAGFAHDFNNLLAVVQGYSSLISQTSTASEEVRKFASSIVTAAERGGTLTQQLMLFGGRQAMECTELELNQVVRETMPLLKKVFGSSIAFTVHHCDEPLFFRGDRKMIQQVLLTIATNAKDAMSAGGSFTVSIKGDVDRQSRRVGRITLVDTGCGMDEQSLDKVFEPFFTTRAVGRGSGLGLCTAYGIIKRHEGSIEVSSQSGAGTRFEVTLPLCDPVVVPQSKKGSAEPDASGETILIVDDEEDLRFMVQNVLQGYGYEVLTAENGVEALRIWEQHRDSIDLLLTDMVMPEGMSGWQLAAKLRADRSDLKVVYTSGYSVDLIADASEELVEGENFVQKPYQPKTLAETLRRALTNRTSH